MRLGYCVGANPEIFDDDATSEDTAKAYCLRCTVAAKCLEWALARNEDGIWGGTNLAERRALKRGGPRASCPGCSGTHIYHDGSSQVCLTCGLSWLL
jgi:WhiB family redox-sensing transcriptional regulator